MHLTQIGTEDHIFWWYEMAYVGTRRRSLEPMYYLCWSKVNMSYKNTLSCVYLYWFLRYSWKISLYVDIQHHTRVGQHVSYSICQLGLRYYWAYVTRPPNWRFRILRTRKTSLGKNWLRKNLMGKKKAQRAVEWSLVCQNRTVRRYNDLSTCRVMDIMSRSKRLVLREGDGA